VCSLNTAFYAVMFVVIDSAVNHCPPWSRWPSRTDGAEGRSGLDRNLPLRVRVDCLIAAATSFTLRHPITANLAVQLPASSASAGAPAAFFSAFLASTFCFAILCRCFPWVAYQLKGGVKSTRPRRKIRLAVTRLVGAPAYEETP
jgi:hypothetical protein